MEDLDTNLSGADGASGQSTGKGTEDLNSVISSLTTGHRLLCTCPCTISCEAVRN